jgi:DNA repair exonuclease SbcCD ATPase subunit
LRYKNLLSTGNSFTEIKLDRSKSTIVMGVNGSGKTSFLDALVYGLYGKPFRDINKPQLINSITGKGLMVEVDFKIGAYQYQVVRGMKPSRFEIYRDGVLINQESKDLDQQAFLEEEVLKISHKSFKQVIVLGSTNYTPFMVLKEKERRGVIEDLLDIQVFSVMNTLLAKRKNELVEHIRNINTELDVARSNLQIHTQHLDVLASDRQSLIKAAKQKKKEVAKTMVCLIEQNNIHQAEIGDLSLSVEDQERMNTKVRKLQDLERQIESRVSDLEKHVHFFESNDVCPTCDQAIDNEFKHLTVDQYNIKVDAMKDVLKDVDTQHKTAADRLLEISGVLNQITEINTKITSNNVSMHHHNTMIDDLNADVERLEQEKINASTRQHIKKLENAIKSGDQEKSDALFEKEIQEISGVLLKDTGIKTKIIRKYIPVINKLINKYLAAMSFYINFELNENFQETIKSLHRDEFGYHSFSEGEKMRINLSILFTWRAIAKLRNSMSTNLLIMDEVFDSSLDSMGVEDFLKIIEDLGGDTNLFVISHKSQMFDKFHSAIEFVKVKNFSQIAPKAQ